MKSRKSFLLAGLAALSLVFAMSCSSPTSSESAPQAEKVTITYKSDKGKAPEAKKVDKGYKLVDADIKALTAEGFTFDGWFNGKLQAKAGDVINANVTFTAKWTAKATKPDTKPEGGGTTPEVKPDEGGSVTPIAKFTITYNAGDQTVSDLPGVKTVEKGYKLVTDDLKPLADTETHLFSKWLNNGSEINEGFVVEDDLVLTASWTEKGAVSSVTFNPTKEAKNGLVPTETKIELKCDTAGATIKYALGEGSEFQTYNPDSTKIIIDGENKDIAIKAYAEKAELKKSTETNASYSLGYTVTFNNNGKASGTTIDPLFIKHDTTPADVPSVEENGYNMTGWTVGSASSGNAYDTNYTVASDIDVFANWEAVSYNINYVLDEETNNQSNPANYTIESQDITLQQPSRAGFKFIGWYTNEDLVTGFVEGVAITTGSTGEKTFYAKWEAEKATGLTVTFNVQQKGDNIVVGDQTEDAVINEPDAPKAAGYVFDGWYETSECNGSPITFDSNLKVAKNGNTFYAKWTPKQFNIIFTAGVETVVGGATKNTLPNVTIETDEPNQLKNNELKVVGKKFTGWKVQGGDETEIKDSTSLAEFIRNYDSDGAKEAGNITLIAQWTEKEFTIQYEKGGVSAIEEGTIQSATGVKISDADTTIAAAPTNANAATSEHSDNGKTFRCWKATAVAGNEGFVAVDNISAEATYEAVVRAIDAAGTTEAGEITLTAQWNSALPGSEDV